MYLFLISWQKNYNNYFNALVLIVVNTIVTGSSKTFESILLIPNIPHSQHCSSEFLNPSLIRRHIRLFKFIRSTGHIDTYSSSSKHVLSKVSPIRSGSRSFCDAILIASCIQLFKTSSRHSPTLSHWSRFSNRNVFEHFVFRIFY